MSYGGYNPYAGDNGGGGRGYNPNPNPFGDENAAGYGGSHEMDSFSRQGYAASPRPMGASPRPMGASPRPMGASPRPMGSPAPGTEHPILKECGEIQSGIQNVEMMLREYPVLKKRCLADADTSDDSEAKKRLDLFRQDIMDQYRVLADRIRTVKSNPESRASSYRRPVERAEGRLRDAIQEFQNQEAEYRQDTKARLARHLRIVNPEATDAQINKAVEDGNTQVFQQAVMGNRTEQANRVLGAVQKRHEEMLQIERSLLELLDLLNDMQELLVKQDVMIQNIATETEEAGEALKDANVQLENATQSARGARKKKWWCLGIGLTIIVIIVVAVVAYILVNRAANGGGGSSSNNNGNNSNNNSGSNSNTGNSNNNNAGSSNTGNSNNNNAGSSSSQKRNPFQRDVLDELQMNTARAATIHSEPAPAGRVARPRFHKVRGVDAALDRAAEADVKKRFVVDWDSVDSTGSED